MKFDGDGYSLQTFVPNNDNQFTTTQRNAAFELPAQLNIGAAYDFLFEKEPGLHWQQTLLQIHLLKTKSYLVVSFHSEIT